MREAKQRTSWVVEGFSQRKKFFSSVGADGVNAEGTGDEGDADGGEGGGGRNVTEGEEHDTRDEDGGGEPLLPVVLLADDEDGESHHWDDLRGLEHNASGVVEVGEGVVGHRHTTVGVHGEDTVVLPGGLARVVGELHLEGTAEEVGEGGEDGHPGTELEAGDAEHALLERGETEGGTEGTAREDEEGEGLVLGEVEAEHLLLLAGGSLLDAARVAAVERRDEATVRNMTLRKGLFLRRGKPSGFLTIPKKHRGRRRRTRVTRHASPPGRP